MIVAIIQARMGSTRLPGKVLKEVSGHPMLWHVVTRVRWARTLDTVVVATSHNASDNPVVAFCEQEGIRCFRGSEDDVLDRYYQAAGWIGADVVVRITADCPLIDPIVVERIVSVYLEGGCDYASNAIERTYPDGLDVEVFSFETLQRAWREASLISEREHVTPYIWKNEQVFELRQVTQDVDLSDLRWTVDEPEDLEFVRGIYRHLYQPGQVFVTKDVLRLLDNHPELVEINQGFQMNEGYVRSLQEDRVVGTPFEHSHRGGSDGGT